MLVDFKRWHQDCTKVEDRDSAWPLSKAMRKEVVDKPSFQWVENHPSLKRGLNLRLTSSKKMSSLGSKKYPNAMRTVRIVHIGAQRCV